MTREQRPASLAGETVFVARLPGPDATVAAEDVARSAAEHPERAPADGAPGDSATQAQLGAPGDSATQAQLVTRTERDAGRPGTSMAEGDAAGARGAAPGPTALERPRYQLREELGRGGMGRVLAAMDRRLGRVVAIKESFADDEDGRLRFEREVAITARLEHPAIVPLYDSGRSADGRAYYVMRKLSGRGLDQVMSELANLDERLALVPALLAACDAVAHAHARGVVHRDLKPGNILVGDHGETTVIDWGLAKAIGDDASAPSTDGAARAVARADAGSAMPPDELKTVVGSVFGTPGFMSPEQARGEQFDLRGDVYALGATLYHLLAGRPPHLGGSATEVIDRVRVEVPTPLAQVCAGAPVELVAIVEKAMAFDVAARYPDASALAGDLRRFLAGQLVAAHRYTWWQRGRRTVRTHRAAFVVAATALVVVAGLVAFSVRRVVSERDQARQARAVAMQQMRSAQVARDQAAARADELVVAQAHGLVAENPTAALALLMRLAPASPLWPKARMVAMRALAEGVARAVPGSAQRPPSIFAMSPRGDQLMVGEDSGRVWLLDLERMRARELVNVGSRPLGCWLDDGASILLSSAAGGIVLRELATGKTRAVQTTARIGALACGARSQVAFLDLEGNLWRLDASFARAQRLADGVTASALELAPDGAWLAVGNTREAVVLDRDGAVRYRFPGEVLRLTSSPGGRLAIMMRARVIELEPDLRVAPVEHPLPSYAISVFFLGERLRVMQAPNRLRFADGTLDVDLAATPNAMASLGDRTTALGLSDGSVWLSGWWGARMMRTPAKAGVQRLAARPGAARLAAWSHGTVLVWNLGGAVPQRLAGEWGISRVVFLGEDRLAVAGASSWRWIELPSGRATEIAQDELPLFNDVVVDAATGDAALVDLMVGRARLLRWSTKQVAATWGERVRCAALLGDGAVAIGSASGRISIGTPERGMTSVQMANPVVGLTAVGRHGVVAIDAEGELLSYDLTSGTSTHGSLGEPPTGPIVDDDQGGVVIALGPRLLRWRQGALSELARFEEPVARLTRYQHHLVVVTLSEISTLELTGVTGEVEVRRIAAATRDQQLVNGSRWAIGIGQRGLIELVDVATGVRWTKSIHGGLAMLAVSPDGSRVAQVLGRDIALWSYDVPEEPAELRGWLDVLTNAVVDDNLDVAWTAPGTP